MSRVRSLTAMHDARVELFLATPSEIWEDYKSNGYTWREMVDEELSYAESVEREP